jgi:transposase-like protein
MKEKDPFDFERFKAEAMQGLYEGKSLSPNDGVLAPLMKHLLESMMDGELENHLNEEKASGNSNRRNGKTKRQSEVSIPELLSWRQVGIDRERSSLK